MDVQLVEILKACGLTGGEVLARRLDLQRLLGEFARQMCAGLTAITHPGHRAARRRLTVFA